MFGRLRSGRIVHCNLEKRKLHSHAHEEVTKNAKWHAPQVQITFITTFTRVTRDARTDRRACDFGHNYINLKLYFWVTAIKIERIHTMGVFCFCCASREFPNSAWKSALNVNLYVEQLAENYQIDVPAYVSQEALLSMVITRRWNKQPECCCWWCTTRALQGCAARIAHQITQQRAIAHHRGMRKTQRISDRPERREAIIPTGSLPRAP